MVVYLIMHGKEVFAARKQKGWSQSRLCEEARTFGVRLTQAQLSEIESAKDNTDRKKLEAIARALGKEWRLY